LPWLQGLGAGIAAIFKAPLAGAIIAAEIFYKEDFEVEALVPALIAAVVGYTIVGAATWDFSQCSPPRRRRPSSTTRGR
jgi:CIC family chloride channel protein